MSGLAAIPWSDLAPFIVIGFLAQLSDATFGMAFGVVTNTLLVAMGLPPAVASAAARTAESFSSGVSGLCHVVQGNVDWSLFARLVIPGIVGGSVGVGVLLAIDVDVLRPVVLTYLSAVGAYLLWRGSRRPQTYRRLRLVGPLGLLGGFLDASGGGWGPVVTGNLLAQGATPRIAIGTANAAEFFVTVTVLAVFIGKLGLQSFTIAASGLLVGAVVASPLGAFLTKRIPPKPLIMMVGGLLLAIGFYGLLSLIFKAVPIFPRF